MSNAQTRSKDSAAKGNDEISPTSARPPLARSFATAIALISTKQVSCMGRRGRRPGATSNLRCPGCNSVRINGQVLNRSGAISFASFHSGS